MGKVEQIKKIVRQSGLADTKDSNDTIKLWESFREQASLWRAIALLQIPLTFIALVFAIIMWSTRDITLEVPPKPLPGIYSATEIPESEFIDYATKYINLIATYQPAVAERQFKSARTMLVEPILSKFDHDVINTELRAVLNTKRSQVFFMDPTKTQIKRAGRIVHVQLVGERFKIVAGRELPMVKTGFMIEMTTIPNNKFNKYGIVIRNVNYKNESKPR